MYPKELLCRMKGIIWSSSLFVCFFTCFAPVFMQSSARYEMVDVTIVKGYQLLSYAPLLAIFIIIAPVCNALLHLSYLSTRKKDVLYAVLAVLYMFAFFGSLILSDVDILLNQDCLVVLSKGAFLIPLGYYLSLGIGILPTIFTIVECDVEDNKRKGDITYEPGVDYETARPEDY